MGRHSIRLDWHPADVKAALEKRGWSLRSLARKHEVDHSAIAQAMRTRYPLSERRIADALGVHPQQIWPSRYGPDGKPNSTHGRPSLVASRSKVNQRSARRQAAHDKSARAD